MLSWDQQQRHQHTPHLLLQHSDGIFLKPTISKKKLQEITGIFAEQGYYYKYENVKNFSVVRENDKLYINMIKNGDEKPYTMYDKNLARNFTKVLQQLENA